MQKRPLQDHIPARRRARTCGVRPAIDPPEAPLERSSPERARREPLQAPQHAHLSYPRSCACACSEHASAQQPCLRPSEHSELQARAPPTACSRPILSSATAAYQGRHASQLLSDSLTRRARTNRRQPPASRCPSQHAGLSMICTDCAVKPRCGPHGPAAVFGRSVHQLTGRHA